MLCAMVKIGSLISPTCSRPLAMRFCMRRNISNLKINPFGIVHSISNDMGIWIVLASKDRPYTGTTLLVMCYGKNR